MIEQGQVTLNDIDTPALVLDKGRLKSNIEKLNTRLAASSVDLRPHVKTSKCIDVVRLALQGGKRGITVSTLKEAEYFLEYGITDILYAVSIAPGKLDRVFRLQSRGGDICLILDCADVAGKVARRAQELGTTFPVLIEIDSDGHRAGLRTDDPEIIAIGEILHESAGTELRGVMTHAGESYNCDSIDAIYKLAEQERNAVVEAAEALKAAGLPCHVVSAGSTPTAMFCKDHSGLTEVRAGVYMFEDLFQANLGVCGIQDIALTVACSVISHQPRRNLIITDAGALALSKDRSTASQENDCGYGLVCSLEENKPIADLYVRGSNQEHGLVTRRSSKIDFSRFPIGSKLRILPNHACLTAASYSEYHVVDGSIEVVEKWKRINGW